ncbi:MAG: ATP-binding protein [Cyanobacteria bacterium P01_D01_bin.56]
MTIPYASSDDSGLGGGQNKPLLTRLKVSQRITGGFVAALGLAFVGTSAGILVGNYYQDRAIAAADYSSEKVSLFSQLQAGVLQSRTHQQQLIPLTESPEDFQDEYSHILKHAETIKTVWGDSVEFIFDHEDSHGVKEDGSKEIHSFFETYDGVAETYLSKLADTVDSIDFDTLDTPSEVAAVQRQLLTFTNSDLAITFDGISDDLSSIIARSNRELTESRQAADAAHRLRNRIILAGMLLSSVTAILLAFVISRSINSPLAALENTAVQISENDSFELRVDVTGDDEVGTVAKAFNSLLNRAESLLCEQKLREEDLERANHQLLSTQKQMIAQEKLASLGSLTAGIAHEIKNPLNFVNNFAELSVELSEELTEELDAQKEQLDPDFLAEITDIVDTLKDNVSKINHHGKRADKIVANMLQHSRNGESEWTTVDINELVAEAVNLAYHGMRAKHSEFNLNFDTDYDDTLPPISVSAQDLSRVFLNIASNACHAVYQRQLDEGEDYRPLLKVRTRKQDQHVAIYIRDNGPGMSPDVKNKVFDQFFTTKPSGEGTGLGLSLSYNIVVDQHGGSMTAESEEGVYTDFIVTLPL